MQIGQINLSRKLTFSASSAMPGRTLLVAILTLLSFGAGVAAAQTMPFRSAQVELIIPVGSGCGIGVHRGPYGRCDVIYGGYYRPHYRAYYRGYHDGYQDGYYDGYGGSMMVDQGACSGFRMHRVCDIYGTCWAACN
jgi:hypothetical protein